MIDYENLPHDKRPKASRHLLGFLVMNGGRDCFAKFGGKVWMLTLSGNWKEICRCWPDLTYGEYLEKSLEKVVNEGR